MSVLDDRKNADFVQFYRDSMKEVRWLMDQNVVSAKLMVFFMEHMDKKNAVVCSYALLQECFECSKATIYRAIKVLQENGFITVLRIGTANVYVLSPDVAWSAWNNGKRYCSFDGKILVSHKENKDFDEALRKERMAIVSKKMKAKDRKIFAGQGDVLDAETGE